MKRIVVLKKLFWHKHDKGGGHTTYEYSVLKNMNDNALRAKIGEMNKPYRTWFWEIIGDYNLTKKKDVYEYADYCLRCARDRFCRDYYSKSVGLVMIAKMEQTINEKP